MIRDATDADAVVLARIYNHYIVNTIITFEEQEVTAADMSERLRETAAATLPWLVCEDHGVVIGYAYASKWKGRCAYRYSAECTVYLDPQHTGRGAGTQLYTGLFERLRRHGLHVLIGGIALPNEASIALHEKFGMEKVAHFRQTGYKFQRWIDVGYWQLILPNASPDIA